MLLTLLNIVHVRQPAKIASSPLLVVQKFTTDYTEYVSHTDCGILLFEAWIPVPGGRLGVAGYLTLSLVKSAVQAARCRRRGAGGAVRATSGEETTVLRYDRHAPASSIIRGFSVEFCCYALRKFSFCSQNVVHDFCCCSVVTVQHFNTSTLFSSSTSRKLSGGRRAGRASGPGRGPGCGSCAPRAPGGRPRAVR